MKTKKYQDEVFVLEDFDAPGVELSDDYDYNYSDEYTQLEIEFQDFAGSQGFRIMNSEPLVQDSLLDKLPAIINATFDNKYINNRLAEQLLATFRDVGYSEMGVYPFSEHYKTWKYAQKIAMLNRIRTGNFQWS